MALKVGLKLRAASEGVREKTGGLLNFTNAPEHPFIFYGRTVVCGFDISKDLDYITKRIKNVTLSDRKITLLNTSSNIVPPSDFLPCSLELAFHLINHHFTHIHPFLPIFNRTDFMSSFHKLHDEPLNMRLSAFLALAVMSSTEGELKPFGVEDKEAFAVKLLDRAKGLYYRLFETTRLEVVQGLLLIAVCEDLRLGKSSRASLWIGEFFLVFCVHMGGVEAGGGGVGGTSNAHSRAIDLGLHYNVSELDHEKIGANTKETMAVTWFCIYILGRQTSLSYGRPVTIRDEDYDVEIPYRPQDPILSDFYYHVTLCHIMGRVSQCLNAARPSPSNPLLENNMFVATKFLADLDAWKESLPPRLHMPRERPGVAGMTMAHYLHAMCWLLVLMVRRFGFGVPDTVAAESILFLLDLGEEVEESSSGLTPEQRESVLEEHCFDPISGAITGIANELSGRVPYSPPGGIGAWEPQESPGSEKSSPSPQQTFSKPPRASIFTMPSVPYAGLAAGTVYVSTLLRSTRGDPEYDASRRGILKCFSVLKGLQAGCKNAAGYYALLEHTLSAKGVEMCNLMSDDDVSGSSGGSERGGGGSFSGGGGDGRTGSVSGHSSSGTTYSPPSSTRFDTQSSPEVGMTGGGGGGLGSGVASSEDGNGDWVTQKMVQDSSEMVGFLDGQISSLEAILSAPSGVFNVADMGMGGTPSPGDSTGGGGDVSGGSVGGVVDVPGGMAFGGRVVGLSPPVGEGRVQGGRSGYGMMGMEELGLLGGGL
ncbi:Transcriptional activator of fatty acid utilization [Rhizophlyctis rosea]|nr:Transcriptional activator of fatty acid utilization [Rhizophlyctis rosea]